MASKLLSTALRVGLAPAFAATLAAGASAQVYQSAPGDIPSGNPANNSYSENVDFGDIDNDGDWDAAFADGGDASNDQNRMWINQGFAQSGTVGIFLDDTAARFPSVSDQSRDIEFVDFDADGDLDIYVSNTSAITPQSNRWWRNTGGGFYTDETSTRWVGIAGAGSSIAPSQAIGGGGFLDFSCDCDFADLDNDGDMDLVHSSYGGVFGGQVPTRLFLNDGSGFFSEFNPSGAQLAGQTITNGFAGIWCEGTQSSNTTNFTGANCDIATSALDIDVADLNGDYDIDILHGARDERPRIFENRLEENGGTLSPFRDMTGGVFPANYAPGGGHYEQEVGDSDNDGDIDIYGLNWNGSIGLNDVTLENNGSGVFINWTNMAGSGDDDNEADYVDYDNDGDLDVFVTSFFGANRLYRNNNNGGGSGFSYTLINGQISPANPAVGLDGDAADVDEDGDYDFWCSNDSGSANTYYKNTNGTADTTAPSLFDLEQAPNRTAGPDPTVVRIKLNDNAPYYINWYDTVELNVTVDAGAPQTIAMQSSGGQIFRGEIPGNLVGSICYSVTASDRYSNQTTSGQLCYTASAGASSFCDASDGALASCPCANPGSPNTGCDIAQSTGGVGAAVTSQNTGTLQGTITATGFPPAASPTAIVIRANNQEGAPVAFGDGLRCVGLTGFTRLAGTSAVGGTSVHTFGHGAGAGTYYYQVWFRNTPVTFCVTTGASSGAFNLSNGQQMTW